MRMNHKFALQPGSSSSNPSYTTYADSGNIDAFSRLRVSNPTSAFHVQCQYDMEPTELETGSSGDGVAPAHGANTRMVQLQVAAGAAGGTSWIQSFQYTPYQPGKSQEVVLTGVMGSGVAGAIKDFGYGDDRNGIFYRQNGAGGLQLVRRTYTSGATVDNAVDQANWNLDTLDGNGPSGITLNPTLCFILFIDLQFLGMGRVRIGFDIDGQVVYAHEFLNANVLALPYMQTASLPIRAEVRAAAGLGGAATAYFKCAAVASEGGIDIGAGRHFAAHAGPTSVASGTPTFLIAFRPRLLFQGFQNRIQFAFEEMELLAGSNSIHYEVWFGPSWDPLPAVQPNWADVDTTYSGMEYADTDGTNLDLTGAILAFSGWINSGGASRNVHSEDLALEYPLTLDRAGANRDMGTMIITAYSLAGVASNANYISVSWREIR